ncbi:hypothetical protein B0H14DRAFT_2588031 [Mycena olivaceomarginata]|nr:hypothetical protein B0H14DRAFT_2588031 [Mycena olivaceomarginata]
MEAKLGQRKVGEQDEASLGRILDTAMAGNAHIGGWSAETEAHGRRGGILRHQDDDVSGDRAPEPMPRVARGDIRAAGHRLHLRIGNRDGDVLGDRKPKSEHRWQEVIPRQRGIGREGLPV